MDRARRAPWPHGPPSRRSIKIRGPAPLVPSIYSIGHPKRWPGPFSFQNGSLLAEGKKFCVERRTTDEEFAEDGGGGSMILCLPERVSEGDAKFQGFCRRWNKWEGQAGGSFFYAKEAPESGGETWFANMTIAYEALSEDKKTTLVDRGCKYSQQKTLQILNPERPPLTDKEKRELPDVSHPMVRVHPETGRSALFVGLRGTPACCVDEMEGQEGIDFLEELRSFATQSQFTYAHQWRSGDAILWDNRCTMHRATVFPDELGRRLCYRTTTEGGVPY